LLQTKQSHHFPIESVERSSRTNQQIAQTQALLDSQVTPFPLLLSTSNPLLIQTMSYSHHQSPSMPSNVLSSFSASANQQPLHNMHHQAELAQHSLHNNFNSQDENAVYGEFLSFPESIFASSISGRLIALQVHPRLTRVSPAHPFFSFLLHSLSPPSPSVDSRSNGCSGYDGGVPGEVTR